jgi:hypothetical protein
MINFTMHLAATEIALFGIKHKIPYVYLRSQFLIRKYSGSVCNFVINVSASFEGNVLRIFLQHWVEGFMPCLFLSFTVVRLKPRASNLGPS